MLRYVKVTSDGVTIVDNKTELTAVVINDGTMFRYVRLTSDRVTIVDNKTELTAVVINDGPICSGM
jgi:hypothetical protein